MILSPLWLLACTSDSKDSVDTGKNDEDNDGWGVQADCDDTDPGVHPAATEVRGDGVDQNCDGTDVANTVAGEVAQETYAGTGAGFGWSLSCGLGSEAHLVVQTLANGSDGLPVEGLHLLGSESPLLLTKAEAVFHEKSGLQNITGFALSEDMDGDGDADFYVADNPATGDLPRRVLHFGNARVGHTADTALGELRLMESPGAVLEATPDGSTVVVGWSGFGLVTTSLVETQSGDDVAVVLGEVLSMALGDVTGNGEMDLIRGRGTDSGAVYEGPFVGEPRPEKDSYATLPNAYAVEVGDVSGDGVSDLIVADQAWGDNLGRVEVYLGPLSPGDLVPDLSIEGEWASAYFGRSLAVGDLNGDGVDDLAIGADHSPRLHVFYGPLVDVTSGADADVVLVGVDNDDFARSVVICETGFAPLAVGAPAWYSEEVPGRVYVVEDL